MSKLAGSNKAEALQGNLDIDRLQTTRNSIPVPQHVCHRVLAFATVGPDDGASRSATQSLRPPLTGRAITGLTLIHAYLARGRPAQYQQP